MNRRSFFGVVGGGAVATALARAWPFSRRGRDVATEVSGGPRTELWVQARMSTGETLNWVIVNPEPNTTYPGPYIHKSAVIESVTATGFPSALDEWPVAMTPMCVNPGDIISLKLGDFKVTDS